MLPAVLSAYIENMHYDYLHRVLSEIDGLLLTVLRTHGKKHWELFEVYCLFGHLKADLEQHLIKEETMLFQRLRRLERRARIQGALPSRSSASMKRRESYFGNCMG